MNLYEFKWKGVNRFLQPQKGTVLATHHQVAENRLLQKGYRHLKIKRNFAFNRAPKKEEVTQFIHQLSLLLNAKITLRKALGVLLENCTNIKLYVWLQEIIALIEKGNSLSDSLTTLDKYFTSQEIQLIKIAERSGQLSVIFCNIADTRAKSEKLTKKVKKVMFYPVIVLGISILLCLMLLIFIVPQFADLYQSQEKSLPLITALLFKTSQVLQQHYIALLSTTIFIVTVVIMLSKKTNIISILKVNILSLLPIFNKIMSEHRIIFFCQNIALMQKAGIPLNIALSSFISKKEEDQVLQKELSNILTILNQGYPFSETLNPSVFGEQVIQMIAIGEECGRLSQMLEHIVTLKQQKLDYKIDILSQLLEPALMLFIGVIIGTIIIALYLPIFDMGALI
ncbi:type II secretion system F family protein [Pasteurella skyensis]|uniref:Type II secretion system F family protein n=1 Tax=Phocoenobacter skyensis TaxID=97481 RepID=A0AAJ6NF71_9PAST|nr:type II secretion system F family protein [Pasteurella skyensis]MDP8170076.1 type II secretion system F family protein [Pasteurella skyensis]MDP8175676.1 type II secretion system F family protein [Pasteurella skyensis]